MSRSANLPRVCGKGEIYFTPKNNEVIGFRSIKKRWIWKNHPKV